MPDFTEIVKSFGYLGIFLIIFAESGMMLGFILPGDTLLFTIGFLASQGYFDIVLVSTVIFVAAIAGDNVGFSLGRKWGAKVFSKNSFVFNEKNLKRTEEFFVRYGRFTVIMGRFVPVVRAFSPFLAGTGKMERKAFFLFDFVGCVLWGLGVTLLGYFLGSFVPNIDAYILPIILLILVLSLLPAAAEYLKSRE